MNLPRATSAFDGTFCRCPFCKSEMEGATVSVEALNAAWQDGETDYPGRSQTGLAESDLVASCPTCKRTSMLALGSAKLKDALGAERRYLRLVPVRTPADVAYLDGQS